MVDVCSFRFLLAALHAPSANGYRTLRAFYQKRMPLNRVIPFGECHVLRTLAEFVTHYHRERDHQGLGNELIDDV